MSYEAVRNGEVMFSQGDYGSSFYVILTGSVEVIVDRNVVRILKPGETFGELALLRSLPRSATIRAAQYSEFLVVEKSDYIRILTGQDERMLLAKTDFIRTVPLFKGITEKALIKLAYVMRPRQLKRETIVVKQGEYNGEVYFIRKGEACVVYEQPVSDAVALEAGLVDNSLPIEVAVLGPGQYFGADGGLDNLMQNVTVRSLTQLSCYLILKEDLRRFNTSFLGGQLRSRLKEDEELRQLFRRQRISATLATKDKRVPDGFKYYRTPSSFKRIATGLPAHTMSQAGAAALSGAAFGHAVSAFGGSALGRRSSMARRSSKLGMLVAGLTASGGGAGGASSSSSSVSVGGAGRSGRRGSLLGALHSVTSGGDVATVTPVGVGGMAGASGSHTRRKSVRLPTVFAKDEAATAAALAAATTSKFGLDASADYTFSDQLASSPTHFAGRAVSDSAAATAAKQQQLKKKKEAAEQALKRSSSALGFRSKACLRGTGLRTTVSLASLLHSTDDSALGRRAAAGLTTVKRRRRHKQSDSRREEASVGSKPFSYARKGHGPVLKGKSKHVLAYSSLRGSRRRLRTAPRADGDSSARKGRLASPIRTSAAATGSRVAGVRASPSLHRTFPSASPAAAALSPTPATADILQRTRAVLERNPTRGHERREEALERLQMKMDATRGRSAMRRGLL
eukprot:PLAT6443.4.p1 GENE.PLAT6443.4~~PLAT6443.4.p1  ORF type:complete len:683 (+),score=352.32 PLAT6443.4:1438-3486(+)